MIVGHISQRVLTKLVDGLPVVESITCAACGTTQPGTRDGFCRIQRCGAPLKYKPASRAARIARPS